MLATNIKDYIITNYKFKRFDHSNILVVNDYGRWVFLSNEEFDKLRKEDIDSELYKKLDDILLTEKNSRELIELIRTKNMLICQGPSLHIVVPTLRCNQKCLYCHSKAKPSDAKGFDMDKETAKKVVDFIFQSPSQHISIEFQGGEPLLNFPMVKYIIEYSEELNRRYKKDLKLGLVTTLTLMTDEILDFLVKHRVGICTSLDGPEELHNKNRPYLGGGASYKDVVKWIKPIWNKSPFKLNALMVPTRFSLNYAKEIVDEYIEKGLDRIQIKFLNKLGYAEKSWDKIGYTPEEFLEYWRKSLDYIITLNKKGNSLYEVITKHILEKIFTDGNSTYLDLMSPCGAAIGQLAYDQNGDIFTCDEARMYELFKLGNVKNDSYKDVLTSTQTCSIVAASTNDTLLCDACIWKPYCGVCPVCNYSEQGNLIPKLALSNRCKIYKGIFEYIFQKILLDNEAKEVFMKWLEP
jgi:His-Xaa-Ser system radical SAM maturase HxsB